MPIIGANVVGTFGFGENTASADTAFIRGIPPYRGLNTQIQTYVPGTNSGNNARPNWQGDGGNSEITRISQVIYTTGNTAHKLTFMRPFNYAYVSTAVAKNTATVVLDNDPGVYSTKMRYPLSGAPSITGGQGPAAVADNALAAGDYVAFQLTDGTWVYDTVASGNYAACVLTTTLPNVTGGGIAAGTAFYFFGIVTDKDPNTGYLCPQLTVPASTTQGKYIDYGVGMWCTLHPNDPMILYSPNGTGAGTLGLVAGYYGGTP